AYGGGVASGVARALGANRTADATRLAVTGLSMATLLGLATTLVMLGFARPLYAALGATGAALEVAVLYSNIVFLGAVPFWLFNTAASILRAGGKPGLPAAAGAICGVLTLVCSPVLIYGWGPLPAFGIAGAAWAVAANSGVMAVVLLRAVWIARAPASPAVGDLVPRRSYAAEILRVSVPSAASSVLTNLTFVVLTGLVAPFGAEAIAGYGAGGRLEYLLIPVVFGMGSALVPLVAASDGAGDFARVQALTRAGALVGAGVSGLAGVVVALAPHAWMRIFTTDAVVIEVGTAYLTRVGPAYGFLGLGLALFFAAQGRGRTVQPLLATSTRLLVAGVTGYVALRLLGKGLDTLFVLMAAGLVLYGSVMVLVMRRELGLWTPSARQVRAEAVAAAMLPPA
ncbi:MAG: family efflux transporter, partial [Armatimonadetes bacterium]|nr:family efflux transporter [Armatimonadota bacterium]